MNTVHCMWTAHNSIAFANVGGYDAPNDDGEWNKNTNKDSGAKNERNQSELYQKDKETDVDDTKGQIVFPVTDTSISDGAVRIPYNGGIFNLYLCVMFC